MGDYPPQYYSPRARKYYRKRPSVAGGGGGASVGSWKELGRTTLGSNGDTITVSSLPDKRYYKFILRTHPADGNTDDIKLSFNGDTGSNYAYRRSAGGQADDTFASTNNFRIDASNGAYDRHVFGYVANYTSKEKLVIAHDVIGQTAGAVPYRIETAGKWTNTSNAISSFTFTNQGAGNFASGSEAIILGYDPADTHTTTDNFWQELASVNATGSSSNLSSGTISARKYLWIQIWLDPSTRQSHLLRFNNDSSSNYATRYSTNGATDSTDGSVTNFNLGSGIGTLDGLPSFQNIFVINNSSNEKLAIINSVWQNTEGANATGRIEMVGKWANTASQITEIDIDSSANWNSGSIIKVWGAD